MDWREELRLASCKNGFSSRYDALLERKRLYNFFRDYALTRVYTPVNISVNTTGTINPAAYEILEGAAKPVCETGFG